MFYTPNSNNNNNKKQCVLCLIKEKYINEYIFNFNLSLLKF